MSDRNSVPSLEDICVRYVTKNINLLIGKCIDCPDQKFVWRFYHPDCRIVSGPAEKILLKLCSRQILKDEHLNLFSAKYVDLISPTIRDVPVTAPYLRILRDFRLANLTATNLKNVSMNSIIGCLSESSVENLVSLNVTNTPIEENKMPVVVSLGRLKNLQVLNVSRTKFTNDCLQNAVKLLPSLRYLNISRTNINNITSLLDLRHRLRGLVMHRLNLDSLQLIERALNTILEMSELRVLDVSSTSDSDRKRLNAVDRLCDSDTLPYLTHFDTCGNLFSLRLSDIKTFIANHPSLEFIGLAAWPSRHSHDLEGIHQLSVQYPHITMLGDRGEKPLLATLLKNKDRRIYLQSAFHNIFEETSTKEWNNHELLATVLRVMRLHMKKADMILAGTAVVYNLTRGDQAARLPPELLDRAVAVTLTAIEHHQEQVQLLKNAFLTLCSDNVLHRAKFSCKRCCELVFKSLIKFNEVHMKRMGVAIISILAAEIPTTDLRELSSDKRRLQQLLIYVVEKCLLTREVLDLVERQKVAFDLATKAAALSEEAAADVASSEEPLTYLYNADLEETGEPVFDTTLRFTLSALWNLTDECPEACQAFVRVGGLLIYAKVLKKMATQPEDFRNHVYTKCLGLLNNVAEVPTTKKTLLITPLMNIFNKMLSHSSIQISYFAAGIVSHLVCLDDEVWMQANQTNKAEFVRLLGNSVCQWTAPTTEMVAYRSFQPFQTLILDPNSRLEIHLWAVWAIHHILTKKRCRYVPILRECPNLQRFLLYAASADVVSLCAEPRGRFQSSSAGAPVPSLPFLNLKVTPEPGGVLRCGPVFVPESWRPAVCASLKLFPKHRISTSFQCTSPGSNSPSSSSSSPFVAPSDSVARFPLVFGEGGGGEVVVSPGVGPSEEQRTCALLLQRLATEIVEAVYDYDAKKAASAAVTAPTPMTT